MDGKIVRDVTAFARVVAVVVIGMGGGTARAWRVPEGGAGRAMKKAGVHAPEAALGSLEDDLPGIGGTSRIPVGSNLMETYESSWRCEQRRRRRVGVCRSSARI